MPSIRQRLQSRGLSSVSDQSSSLSEAELYSREMRKTSFHLIASKNKLPDDPEESQDYLYSYLTSTRLPSGLPSESVSVHKQIGEIKKVLLLELAKNGGDVETTKFNEILNQLVELHDPTKFDARVKPLPPKKVPMKIDRKKGFMLEPHLEGMWISLSQPKFFDCLGVNESGDPIYTLGRMSFDMFHPTKLICSIRGTFNSIKVVGSNERLKLAETAPKALRQEIKSGEGVLRTYRLITAFAIEPSNNKSKVDAAEDSPNKNVDHPIEALMTTESYVLANPKKPDRLSIWFTGGSIELNNTGSERSSMNDVDIWRQIFQQPPEPSFLQRFKMIGARVGMGANGKEGMEIDGKMSYHLSRPIGGHEIAYVDVLYLDETLRIVKSSSGSVHVMVRVPSLNDD